MSDWGIREGRPATRSHLEFNIRRLVMECDWMADDHAHRKETEFVEFDHVLTRHLLNHLKVRTLYCIRSYSLFLSPANFHFVMHKYSNENKKIYLS